MKVEIQPQLGWTDYQNFKDITTLPSNTLIAGSQNVFINDEDVVEVRSGMKYFGATGTDNTGVDISWVKPHRIHSTYDDFVNNSGITIPVRSFYSGTTLQGDVVECWFDNEWRQISGNVPTYKIDSVHKHYYAEYYDPRNLQNHLIFTFGQKRVGNWTGGAAKITAVTATTITISTPFVENGFIDILNPIADTEAANFVVVNGVEYVVLGGLTTNTITVASTAGISVNDYIFQGIRTDTIQNENTDTQFVADVCSMVKNQVYYHDWKQRNRLVSWNRNRGSDIGNITYSGSSGINDMVASGIYIGTATADIKITIDDVPDPSVRKFVPAPAGGTEDVIIFTGSHTGITRDTYKVITTSIAPFVGVNCYRNNTLIASTTLPALYTAPLSLGNGISVSAISPAEAFAVGTVWTYEVGGQDTFTWYLNGVLQTSNNGLSGGLTYQGASFNTLKTLGHNVGDTWQVTLYPAITRGWRQVYYTPSGRLAGEGWKYLLDSNGWTLSPQEDSMYDVDSGGRIYTITNQLTSSGEMFSVERLKTDTQNKVLFPYLFTHIKNYLASISLDKTYDILGRQQFLELPQTRSLSDVVRTDFETADWKDGCIKYFKRKIYFSVPNSGRVFVYDDFKGRWQPPQTFGKQIGQLSIIDGKLIGHSYEINESYELFTGTNDLDIFPINTAIITAYSPDGERYQEKSTNAVGFEGYMDGAPDIDWVVNFGIGGCLGSESGKLDPVFCRPPNTASLGKSNLGFHGLGNDPVDVIPYFQMIRTFSANKYYLRNIELRCSSLNQRWSLISTGNAIDRNNLSNSSITNKDII